MCRGCVIIGDFIGAVRACVDDAARILSAIDLSPEYRHRLMRDVLGSADCDGLRLLMQQVLDGAMVAEVVAGQLPHGGWARFGTEDLTVRRKVPTTAFAMHRLVWLGLTKEDEPLARALDYLKDLFEGRRAPPEGGEVNERWPEVLRIRCALLIVLADPLSPVLDATMERWRFIAENTFRNGAYDYSMCRDLQAGLLDVRGPRLIPIPLRLLASRLGFLSAALERTLLLYCWQRHLDGFLYWPEGRLDRLPEEFFSAKTNRYMNTMESMVCFRGCADVLRPSIQWLMDGRGEDGLWDCGPQAKDPAGYPRRLAAMDWRKPVYRKLDCTMEVLALLKQYIENNG